MRSTANSIENSGYFFGAGLASLMILIIKKFGWRAMYFTMGSIGLVLSFLTLVLIKNPQVPKRGGRVCPTEDEECLPDYEELDQKNFF